jgi:pilus assembly protein Flp/PilA
MKKLIARFIKETEGQDLIEYALLAGAISLAALAGMQFLGTTLDTQFSNLGDTVAAQPS